MDETRPVPVAQGQPEAGQPAPKADPISENDFTAGAGETRPVLSAREAAEWKAEGDLPGEAAGPAPPPAGPSGRWSRSYSPPPPPNWPDREGWQTGRPAQADRSRAENAGAAEKEPPATAPPARVEPGPVRPEVSLAESGERAEQEAAGASPVPLYGPDLAETRPVPASLLPKPGPAAAAPSPASVPPPVFRLERSPALDPASVPAAIRAGRAAVRKDRRPAHPAAGSARSLTPGRALGHSLPQSRLQRALTAFVLGATLLMALGTVAVAVYIYQPELANLPLLQPLSLSEGLDGEDSAFPQVSAPPGTPLGEQLSERVALGTPFESTGAGGPTIEPGSAIQVTVEAIPYETLGPFSAFQEAEIGFVDKGASPSGEQTVTVTVYNYSGRGFEVTSSDVTLVPPGTRNLAPVNSSPSLPARVNPGETIEFTFTFPAPASGAGTIKIFSNEFDLNDF
jgi:hypothetical protein